MASNWLKFPSQTPAASKVRRDARRATPRGAAERSRARLWNKSGGAKGGPYATTDQLEGLWHGQRGLCGLTGVELSVTDMHLDHIIPRSKGGGHTVDNLRWTHPMANSAKGDRSDEEFYAWLDAVVFRRVLT